MDFPAPIASHGSERKAMTEAWQILAKGFGIGLGVAAPIGPVNIEIIRRGLRSGFREAFALGMGAVTADGIYLALVCLGVSRVAEYAVVRVTLPALGVVMLEALGVLAFRDAMRLSEMPRETLEPGAGATSSLRCYGLGMAMMATNPLSMAAWLGFSSVVIGSTSANSMAYVWFALSVPAGCATWVVFISSVLHFGRRFVNVAVLRAVNLISGLFLCGFGLHLLWQAING